MPRADPLPAPFASRAFAVSEAIAAGISISRLRAKDLVIPTRGVRAGPVTPANAPPDESASMRLERLRDELLIRAERIAPALTDDQFFSHDTALAAIGAPLPYTVATSRDVHIATHRPLGQPRRKGTVGHRLQLREPAPWRARGLPIEHPARAWRQVGARWSLDDLIVAGDFLVLPRRQLLTFDDLRDEVAAMGDTRNHILTRALQEIRIGSETAEETRLRLAILRAGLPEPDLNIDLVGGNGRFIARLDLAYRKYRVAVEHDGRIHAFDDRQFARDADRWDEIRAAGWTHVRILSHHLHPSSQPAVNKVASALLAAGWRPGVR